MAQKENDKGNFVVQVVKWSDLTEPNEEETWVLYTRTVSQSCSAFYWPKILEHQVVLPERASSCPYWDFITSKNLLTQWKYETEMVHLSNLVKPIQLARFLFLVNFHNTILWIHEPNHEPYHTLIHHQENTGHCGKVFNALINATVYTKVLYNSKLTGHWLNVFCFLQPSVSSADLSDVFPS